MPFSTTHATAGDTGSHPLPPPSGLSVQLSDISLVTTRPIGRWFNLSVEQVNQPSSCGVSSNSVSTPSAIGHQPSSGISSPSRQSLPPSQLTSTAHAMLNPIILQSPSDSLDSLIKPRHLATKPPSASLISGLFPRSLQSASSFPSPDLHRFSEHCPSPYSSVLRNPLRLGAPYGPSIRSLNAQIFRFISRA
jgi:hypothetical protein